MNKNIKVAKELVKLAKSLVGESGYTYGYGDFPVRYSKGRGKINYLFCTENEELDSLSINGESKNANNICLSAEMEYSIIADVYYDEVNGDDTSLVSYDLEGVDDNYAEFFDGDTQIQLNDDDVIEFNAWFIKQPFKGQKKDLINFLMKNMNDDELMDEQRLFEDLCIQENIEFDDEDCLRY